VRIPVPRIRETRLLARSRLAAPLVRLTSRRDPAADPLRRALRTTLLGQVSADERAWSTRIEARRHELITQRDPTGMPTFEAAANGPGGRFAMGAPETTIGTASALMSLSPHWCVLLMRLVRELRPRSCLELGTGFGISTAYQAAALELNGAGAITTLEGSVAWAQLAEEGFEALELDRVTMRVAPIEEALPEALARSGPFDFVFIDAEHQADATVDHFEAILPRLTDGAMVVLDDVDWDGVKRAQTRIGRHERVSTSAFIGRLGVSVIGAPASP
jgi:predicted O-methyltransferase YrrM